MSPRSLFFGAAAAYVILPGHWNGWLRGMPLGLWPLAAVCAGAAAWWYFRDDDVLPPAFWGKGVACLALFAALKVALAMTASPPARWVASYFANGEFAGEPRRSTDFPGLAATRIDRRIDFRDDYLPVYFLNEAGFNRGIRREVTEPVSVRWVGRAAPAVRTTWPMTLEARGQARVAIDGEAVLEASASTGSRSANVTVDPGVHEIRVEYVKPADTDPLIVFRGIDVDRGGAVSARAVDLGAMLVFVLVVSVSVSRAVRHSRHLRERTPRRLARALAMAMLVLFVVQGVQAAAPLQHRAVSLSGGDDWLGFEARAREILTGGPLMRFGQPLGSGDAFYYYPGYSYFLAAVHAVGGEDLSSPIFVHFILLFLTNVVVFRMAESMFNRTAAIGAVGLLVLIEEIAFIRHYTTTILSENLYILTVAVSLYSLMRFAAKPRFASLAWSGFMAGVSSLIRPAMMLYLPPAMLVIAALCSRVRWPLRRSVSAAAVFAVAWMAVVSLATIRNYVVAGSSVLISTTPAQSFILYNLPASGGAEYMEAYKNRTGVASALQILGRIAIEHPGDTMRSVVTKVGFSLGWLQWMGGRMHPELLIASAGYLISLVLLPAARSAETWPIHAFIAAHLGGLVLTMPSNYGYRLLLPMYVFFPIFAAAAAAAALERFPFMTSRLRIGTGRMAQP